MKASMFLFRLPAACIICLLLPSLAKAQSDPLTISGEFQAWWVDGSPGPDLYDVIPNLSAAQGRMVYVGSVAELRTAIDQGGNSDVVILAAGNYLVDAPLKLKPGMQLVGQNRYVELADGGRELIPGTETILDGSLVAAEPGTLISDCEDPAGTFSSPRAIIENAGFHNCISRVTVRSAVGIGFRSALAVEPGTVGLELAITDCVFENCRLGIAFLNAGCGMSGAKSAISVERSIFRNNQRGIAMFQLLTYDATTVATLYHNIFSNNTVAGVQLGGGSYGSDDSNMLVFSVGNQYVLNNAGYLLLNGWHGVAGLKSSDNNLLSLMSHSDVYFANVDGIRVRNALITLDQAAPSSGNTTRLDILNGLFYGNDHHLDATAWADGRTGDSGPVGVHNTVELLIRNTAGSADATFAIFGGSPTEPSNRVTIIGSKTALERANLGLTLEEYP